MSTLSSHNLPFAFPSLSYSRQSPHPTLICTLRMMDETVWTGSRMPCPCTAGCLVTLFLLGTATRLTPPFKEEKCNPVYKQDESSYCQFPTRDTCVYTTCLPQQSQLGESAQCLFKRLHARAVTFLH